MAQYEYANGLTCYYEGMEDEAPETDRRGCKSCGQFFSTPKMSDAVECNPCRQPWNFTWKGGKRVLVEIRGTV